MSRKLAFNNYLMVVILNISLLGLTNVFCQTKAHEKSSYAIIDPSYSVSSLNPSSQLNEKRSSWIYGSAELETWRLQLLMARKDSAKLNVGYPGVYHKPYNKGLFQLKLVKPVVLDVLKFKSVGSGKVYINGHFLANFNEINQFQGISVKGIAITTIKFELYANENPPALLIEQVSLSTSQKNWKWKSVNSDWTFVTHYPQNIKGSPPHLLENGFVNVNPIRFENNLIDFGRELFGYVFIDSETCPLIVVGESKTEALDRENKKIEQTLEMVQVQNGAWRSKVPLAFRYVFSENKKMSDVHCKAIFHAARYRGAFACSDSMLTKIWMNSAYTLRLCMQDFLLDGIKRDRLPWTGDMAMSMLVNSYTFGDAELVRRSLVALGRAGIKEKDINGIIDYSLWWIIAQDQYQLYYGDKEHLVKEWGRIKEALNVLDSRSDKKGFLIAQKDNWLFIDWVEQEKWTALQIMWWWAQHSAVLLAERMGDTNTANIWRKKSQNLTTNLYRAAWNEREKVWMSGQKNTSNEKTRHPNFLAIIAGIIDKSECKGIQQLLENDTIRPVGTPYMAGFEMMAVAQLGNIDYTLKQIVEYWGGMMAKGATSFWEAYDATQSGAKQYSYYGRPYAKSLCHAWSSGPAAILPSQLVGLKPLADGWKRFTINPNLGLLKWVNVNVPTKYGDITIDIEDKTIEIKIPKGTTLEWRGKSFVGGHLLKDKLK